MKRLLVPTALVAVLAVPATAAAGPQVTKSDRAEAKRECLQLKRAAESKANLASLVKAERKSAKVNARTAFKQCINVRGAEAAQERKQSRSEAVEACRAEHGTPGSQRGRPSEPKSRSAFGKCVAAAAKAKNREADAEQRERSLNPARACRAEQEADKEQFAATYGTKSNAFGKCVSAKAEAQQDDQAEQTPQA